MNKQVNKQTNQQTNRQTDRQKGTLAECRRRTAGGYKEKLPKGLESSIWKIVGVKPITYNAIS